MSSPEVSILIPNYRTAELTKLCLRLIKKHTDLSRIKVIVIDNDSQDESLEYLRTVSWITLIERKAAADDTPPLSHRRALDLGLAAVTTPYFASFHTDTLVTSDEWLDVLLNAMKSSPKMGGVGSWKLQSKPEWKLALKKIEGWWQQLISKITGKPNRVMGVGNNYYFLRSHCALYRKDLFDELALTFSEGDECAGKLVHKKLVDAGYDMIFLPSDYLSRYMDHLNHATMVLNPHLKNKKEIDKKELKRIQWKLRAVGADKILADTSLD